MDGKGAESRIYGGGNDELDNVILPQRHVGSGSPQCTATINYEGNNACASMVMAKKTTPRTRHIDIKYHFIGQWVEQDLIKLERVASIMNVDDIFTKQLVPLLFWRHCDYLMGRVPPQYSSHYQNIHLVSNPEQLQKDGGCVEGEE